MKVKNLGPNQVEVQYGCSSYLQSYETVVARRRNGDLTLDPAWDCSKTTAKHVAKWAGLSAMLIRKDIKAGIIKVEDLSQDL